VSFLEENGTLQYCFLVIATLDPHQGYGVAFKNGIKSRSIGRLVRPQNSPGRGCGRTLFDWARAGDENVHQPPGALLPAGAADRRSKQVERVEIFADFAAPGSGQASLVDESSCYFAQSPEFRLDWFPLPAYLAVYGCSRGINSTSRTRAGALPGGVAVA